MDPNQKNNQNNPAPDIIHKFLAVQNRQEENEKDRIELQKKQIEYNYNLANKNLEIQEDILKKREPEKRTTLLWIFGAGLLTLLIILIFIYFIIDSGHEGIALKIADWGSYALVALASYFAGKKSKSKDKKDIDN